MGFVAEMEVLAAEGSKLDAALQLKKEGFPLKAVISFDEVRFICMRFGACGACMQLGAWILLSAELLLLLIVCL